MNKGEDGSAGDRLAGIVREIHAASPADRPRLVDELCGDDAALRSRVERALAREFVADALLGDTGDSDTIEPSAAEVDRGRRIGPYRILGELGEGGMGSVYLAEQETPVRRRVALKIIKLGMDTREVVARFEAERQALALMNHPAIARVYDAGSTIEGRPYFAMEHVPGVPITEYCDRHKLGLRDRLELFMQVCQGVQHAHHKGVIHRDIKPSNILVSTPDEGPVAKIIDFGVAKATNQRLTAKTIYTELGRAVGTPAYMSPEQAEMTAEDVDHRTDVYSLGVLLYELLVGELPLDWDSLSKVAYDEVLRRIREEEPLTPSTRWSRLNVERTTRLANQRCTSPGALRSELRGDLDWIAMKAIDKDRERRYSTASQLSEDIARYLANEPVAAGPPGVLYRLRKYAHRHRPLLAASAAVAAALSLGLVASLIFAFQSRENARRAATNAQLAERRLQDVLLRTDRMRLIALTREADDLWPAVPARIPEMEEWLRNARDLVSRRQEHEAALESLRAQALPLDDESRARQRDTHPLAPELEELRERRARLLAEAEEIVRQEGGRGATVLDYGSDAARKRVAYYFRGSFDATGAEASSGGRLRLIVDDGAIVHLNGQSVAAIRMPGDVASHATLAAEAVSGHPIPVVEVALEPGIVRGGRNLLAVEVHQAGRASGDLFFDLELTAGSSILLGRGARWRYRDASGPPPPDWASPDLDDTAWPVGEAPLGYGFMAGPGRALELRAQADRLVQRIERLEGRIGERHVWTFPDADMEWKHNVLVALVAGLERFTDPDHRVGAIAAVEERLTFARTVHRRSVSDHRDAWEEACRCIADRRCCPHYGGMRIEPQLGLVPVHRNPRSGLWEFAHIQTGEVPGRDGSGRLLLTEATGIVLVLLPPGSFAMGAIRPRLGAGLSDARGSVVVEEVSPDTLADRLGLARGDRLLSINGAAVTGAAEVERILSQLGSGQAVEARVERGTGAMRLEAHVGPNVDPFARPNEAPVHEVELEPFFISKYEMTQGQWERITGFNPSHYRPDRSYDGKQHSLLHPVETVSWEMCDDLLGKLGLALPTEAQWEYAARARTTTVWWTGNDRDTLEGKVNLADLAAFRAGANWGQQREWPELDDGYAIHAPAGAYPANGFGIHEILGNVWEWCRDLQSSYDVPPRAGDGLRPVPLPSHPMYVYRGGAFNLGPRFVRSAVRSVNGPWYRQSHVGVRPARALSMSRPRSP